MYSSSGLKAYQYTMHVIETLLLVKCNEAIDKLLAGQARYM